MLAHTSSNYDHNAELHVMTVYYGLSERNSVWLDLQQKFLRKHTKVPYRFSVFMNGCHSHLFNGIDVVGVEPYQSHHQMGRNHLECLKKAAAHFDESCKYFLILDSDCFPIMDNWHQVLERKMTGRGFNMAAPFRFENLDMFPHPCAMFMNRQGMQDLKLSLTQPNDSILGGMPKDPTCTNKCFPLVRSNRVNVHPLAAGVYYDMFYHHGAGSRNSLFRITDVLEYWDYPDHSEWVNRAYDLLVEDPEGFLATLMANPCE